MFPDGFIERIRTQEYIHTEKLLKALEEPSPASIRVNTFKWNAVPLKAERVPWCRSGYYLESRPSFTLDPLFHAGCYYVQEASGMFIEQIFSQVIDTAKNIRVLDLCAAPGGKSTHLSTLIGPDGILVSNEAIGSRVSALNENIIKWGLPNTVVTHNDPSSFSDLTGFFDVILADVPCSGEGMFRNMTAVREWSEGKTAHCSVRQKRIIAHVWPALKRNGILIYSTCTFNPAENEENIKWLLETEKCEIAGIDISQFHGISRVGNYGYGFYPDRIRGEGFFVSAIRKTGYSQELKINRGGKQITGPSGKDPDVVSEWTNFNSENILKQGDEIYYFPGNRTDRSILFDRLNIINPGTRICTVKGNVYLPAHELLLSGGLKGNAFPVRDLDYGQAIGFLRKDVLKPEYIPEGWFIAAYKGVNIGLGNNIGNRVNNYYPKGWRIRMPAKKAGFSGILEWVNEKTK